MTFRFSTQYDVSIALESNKKQLLDYLEKEAKNRILAFKERLSVNIFDFCNTLTIGVDGSNCLGNIIEFVAIISKNKISQDWIIEFTGKSYPVSGQQEKTDKN